MKSQLILLSSFAILHSSFSAPPNILFLLSDDHSYPFLSTYGSPNDGPVRNTVVTGGPQASRLVLSQVKVPKGLPTALPACPSLRGQACRTYVAPAPQTPGPAPK